VALDFLAAVMPAVGGAIYRVRGGAGPDLPRFVDLLLYSLYPAALVWWIAGPWWAAGVLAVVMVMVSKAHGDGIDFGHSPRRDPDELISRLIRWARLSPKPDGYRHDTIYMTISGLVTAAAPAVAFAFVGYGVAALLILAGGAAKGLAYYLSWSAYDAGRLQWLPENWDPGAELGEVLTGVFFYAGLTLAYFFV
jgi:hypothetical protein